MVATAPITRRHRLAVTSRVVAAVAGGYAVAALFGIALATVLPLDAADAAMAATLMALPAIPVGAMTCFALRSATRAWVVMGVAGSLFAALALAGGWQP